MLSSTVGLITGGASGLGRAAASRILAQGGKCIIADLPMQEELASTLTSEYGSSRVLFSPTDVTSTDDVTAALDLAENSGLGVVNCAVSCAGIATPSRVLGKKGVHDLDLFANVLKVNTVGTFNVNRLAAERMANVDAGDSGLRGVLVNTASIAAYDGQVGQAAYAASKGAIVSMTLAIARDLAPKGIRCMTIAPGLFLTPLLAGLPEKIQNELGSQIPCPNKLGDPEDYGKLVETIINNPMLNGETIRLDGAYRMPP